MFLSQLNESNQIKKDFHSLSYFFKGCYFVDDSITITNKKAFQISIENLIKTEKYKKSNITAKKMVTNILINLQNL